MAPRSKHDVLTVQFTREALEAMVKAMNESNIRSSTGKRIKTTYRQYAGEKHRADFGYGIPTVLEFEELSDEIHG
jgi:hypothetical protein